MGKTFCYIADDAMFPCDGEECHLCETEESPLYLYFGEIIHPEHAANPQLAREEPEISELCAECILSGHVRRNADVRIQKTINRFAKDKQAAWEAFHRTPDIPLFLQYTDWPMCCGDWCEFVGVPSSYDESKVVPDNYHYWEDSPKAWKSDFELMPETLREISLFRCLDCEEKLFTWQFT